ncbi:hypothetical protein [Ethanoligenens harbinense]|uniref:Uncharacterized protein n=1 Tax=Ethanoligenens harbinense (strain DSM 18485 / JCM 12961 / CGMCC 1.5033 / YUAN-3) TaxID=663278 RepID=E6U5A5_ETHHY|nr:hypothetical protein [Ethanoligenens harbinense]ADU27918.1 hypothetical protein Ethha_2422 [Ethanoligenens harbinense YUAN-3]AVQ96947.1 hypothetical protein CXQ68_12450 [Ethanoligenens harbinense YUAN-3]AYF39607.1 hypothetical protein CXP51_12345 [Ethanoligenens harbinense]AYF42434.1 hypothetical protein CN246_12895 [Ethanoligenens harbinense]QCN93186.1 hypothetical protein DRA42_12485 [Ethanoligenens harbinense]
MKARIIIHFIVAVALFLFSLYVWNTTKSEQPFFYKAFEYLLLAVSLIISIKHIIQFMLSIVEYRKTIKYNASVERTYIQNLQELDRQGFHLAVRFDTEPKVFIDDIHKWFAILYENGPMQIYRYADIIKVNKTREANVIKIALKNVYNPCIFIRTENLYTAALEKFLSTLEYIQVISRNNASWIERK